MNKKIILSPEERKRLRDELRAVYIKQADYVQRFGDVSTEIADEINCYRERLGEVQHTPIKIKKERSKGPRPPVKYKRGPWRCSNLECQDIIKDITQAYQARKKHYCSLRCALADDNKEKQA